jgi:glycosyltransferase involved in cell wall biosynthesis
MNRETITHNTYSGELRREGDNDLTEKRPAVSAIMPTYNVERHVREALDSVLRQTWQDWELIIVDDGSSDDTPKILEDYASRDSRIHLYLMGHCGRGKARNACLERSRGKYIAICDSDDIFHRERFALQVAFLESNPKFGVVSANYLFFSDDLPLSAQYVFPDDPERISAFFEKGKMGACHPVSMFRKELLDSAGPYCPELLMAEDLDLFLRFNEITRFYKLPEILLHYRCNPAHLDYGTWVALCGYARYAVHRRNSMRKGRKPLTIDEWRRSIPGLLMANLLDSLKFIAFLFGNRLRKWQGERDGVTDEGRKL